MSQLLTDTGIVIRPDPTRVLARFYVPGREDLAPGKSRAGGVVDRVLALDEPEVRAALQDVERRFGPRHRDLDGMLRDHASRVLSRVDPQLAITDERLRLLGAVFTREDAIEGAALCNPSIVPHPQQRSDGAVDFVIGVRCIGEGHRSSIGFRTGSVRDDGSVTIDEPGSYPETAEHVGLNLGSVLRQRSAELGDEQENVAFVLDALPDEFDDDQLEERIGQLVADSASRSHIAETIAHLRASSTSSYRAEFHGAVALSDRVLWPYAPAESNGMEDARFVRFVDDDGAVTYYATYTAFNGTSIAQHLLATTDFRTFRSSPLTGPGAIGKGLALFPRRIGGRFMALGRPDRETNEIAVSDDMTSWIDPRPFQVPERAWEAVQLGNCGSPIETDDGWLVLTHGVGPMRTYCLGALLLDLDDPTIVLARTDGPVLVPAGDRWQGYVPNVVYTCGWMAHGDLLVVPYGMADQSIAIATGSVRELIASMRRVERDQCIGSHTPRRRRGDHDSGAA